jgi:hypothetical protein
MEKLKRKNELFVCTSSEHLSSLLFILCTVGHHSVEKRNYKTFTDYFNFGISIQQISTNGSSKFYRLSTQNYAFDF